MLGRRMQSFPWTASRAVAWQVIVLLGLAGAAVAAGGSGEGVTSQLPAAACTATMPGLSIPLGIQALSSPSQTTQSFHTEFGAVTHIFKCSCFMDSIAAGDLDGDGNVDVVTGIRVPPSVQAYFNPGPAGGSWRVVTVTTALTDPFDVAAVDLDGDGDLDLLATSEPDNTIAWYENVYGDGRTWAARTITTSATGVRYVFPADIDGDGDMDFAVAIPGADTIAWYENAAGDGSVWTFHLVSTYFPSPQKLVVADLDGDGDMDLVVTDNAGNQGAVAWFENTNGQGTAWTLHIITTSVLWPRAVAVGDLDGDGHMDVASASRNDDTIAWYHNNGDSPPTFTMHVLVDNPGWSDPAQAGQCNTCSPGCGFADGANDVKLADFDLDGDLDIVAEAAHSDRIFWLENSNGDGSFWRTHNLVNPGNPRETALADVDGDGDIDVLYVNKSEPDSPDEPLAIPGRGVSWVANDLLPGPPPPFTGICSDGVDNDGDCLIDFPADPGCRSASSNTENPQCNDYLDNDGDGAIDAEGGPNGEPPDPQCIDVPWSNDEAPASCGLGGELVLALPLLFALRRVRGR
jgi:hypothetical protein